MFKRKHTTWFGQLRSMMQQPKPSASKLFDLMRQTHARFPDRYREEWLPYLQGFELPVFTIQEPSLMANLRALLPPNARCRLDLNVTGQNTDILQCIQRSDCAHQVVFLSLQHCHISAMAEGYFSRWSQLKHLDLSNNPIDQNTWLGAIEDAPLLQTLETLHLDATNMSITGAAALAHVHFERLRDLSLQANRFLSEEMHILSDTLWWTQLKALDLSHNRIGDHGVLILEDALPNMQVLRLDACQLSNASAERIAHSPYITTLETLSLWGNAMTSSGLDALIDKANMPKLKHLSLGANQIDDALLEDANNPTELEHLVLSDNAITDEGARRLLRHPILAKLKRLILTGNDISDAQIQALKETPYPRLRVGFRR